MSKAFTKEDDGGSEEIVLEDDFSVPEGARNYMTPAGAAALRKEHDDLAEAPRGDKKAQIERRLRGLKKRLELLEVVDPLAQPTDRVLFGATVTVLDDDERERRYRIVGID